MKTVELELGGATRRLALDLNAVIALQTQGGMDAGRIGITLGDKKSTLGEKIKAMRLIVWAMLASSCPDFEQDPATTLHQVGSWIGMADMAKVTGAIETLISDYVGESGDGPQLAPYVPTDMAVVEAMLDAAEIKPESFVYDLGAGDGRLLFGALDRGAARVIGYELHEDRYPKLFTKAKHHPLTDRITILQANIFDADVSGADVIMCYLLPNIMAMLKPKFQAECKPGCRIVSHDFGMPDWEPEFTARPLAEDRAHTVYRWTVPERAAAAA